MIGWIKNAAVLGTASGVVTLTLNSLGLLTSTPDTPRSDVIPALGFLVFIGLMVAAGFSTARGGGSLGRAAVAGLIGGAVSSVGTVLAAVVLLLTTNAGRNVDAGLAGLAELIDWGVTLAVALVASLIGIALAAGLGAIGGVLGRRSRTNGYMLGPR
jgi:hypothetical protein